MVDVQPHKRVKPWRAFIPIVKKNRNLSQFAQQLRDARQSLSGPFEVSVLKHQLDQLGVPGAHRLLQD